MKKNIADIEAKLSQANYEKIPFIETIPLQQALSKARYEYIDLIDPTDSVEKRIKTERRVPVFYPKEKGWINSNPQPEQESSGVPVYVYPDDAIVDAGYEKYRYCAFEIELK
jgi:hypothetical protein